MKKPRLRTNGLAFAFVCFFISVLAKADDYLIQAGDLLEVSVWKESDLQREVLVTPDGGVSFPLVGNVNAKELSIADLQGIIADKLTRYIPDPVVTVALKEVRGNSIYVIGKVVSPGAYVAPRQIDVVQALAMAGGMTPYAASSKIKILRRENGKQSATQFRYDQVEKGQNLAQNILLKGGDVVIVP